MSLLQDIKDAQLVARKARNGVRATMLTTLIGESAMIGKSDGNRESTDAEVLEVMRKFEKNLKANIELYKGDNGKLIATLYAKQELELLAEFLPQKITDEQVKYDIENVICEYQLDRVMKSMGVITKALSQIYGDQYDGAQVSTIFKGML